eukprot:1245037-Pleurochrysis_carterae.AAC.1
MCLRRAWHGVRRQQGSTCTWRRHGGSSVFDPLRLHGSAHGEPVEHRVQPLVREAPVHGLVDTGVAARVAQAADADAADAAALGV